jgi:hypothetical protein
VEAVVDAAEEEAAVEVDAVAEEADVEAVVDAAEEEADVEVDAAEAVEADADEESDLPFFKGLQSNSIAMSWPELINLILIIQNRSFTKSFYSSHLYVYIELCLLLAHRYPSCF